MDNVLYTDGHDVKVTSNRLIVGSAQYLIAGILNARMNLIKANVAGAVVLLIVGLLAVGAGYLHYFTDTPIGDTVIGSMPLTANLLAVIIGAVLVLASIIWMIASHNRYAVHITTAEGDKEPLVSTKRDYVAQIVAAINKAIR